MRVHGYRDPPACTTIHLLSIPLTPWFAGLVSHPPILHLSKTASLPLVSPFSFTSSLLFTLTHSHLFQTSHLPYREHQGQILAISLAGFSHFAFSISYLSTLLHLTQQPQIPPPYLKLANRTATHSFLLFARAFSVSLFNHRSTHSLYILLSPPNMGLPTDFLAPAESTSPFSKRRRFSPHSLPPIIPLTDNSDIEAHTFDSPLLLQLCEQAPDQAEIETGLLQVGMRVRKSVAEGYKNQQKKFTPRPFFNVNRLSPETQAALVNGNSETGNELLPYSISQSQPLSTATYCGVSLAFMSHYSDDMSNSEFSEQNMWSYSTSHKRGYENDSDSDESQDWQPQTPTLVADAVMDMPVDYFNIGTDSMSDVSPMTQIGDRTRQANNGRRIAMPKSRNRPVPSIEQPTSSFNPFSDFSAQPVENNVGGNFGHKRMMSCGMEAMDFSEATFLSRRDDMEMDCS